MKIESAIAEELAAALAADDVAPADPTFVSQHGTGDVGDMNSSSATTPMDTGLNAGAGTRPATGGFMEIAHNPDYSKNVAEAKAAHLAADLSLRRFRDAPIVSPGTVPGLAPHMKGQENE